MKRINFTLLFGLLAIAQVFAQKTYKTTFEVQYKVVSYLDSLHPKDKRTETGFLYTGTNSGVYLSYFDAAQKGVLRTKTRKKLGLVTQKYGRNRINPSLSKTIYKNHQTNQTVTVEDIPMGKTYQFKEPVLSWKIKDSAKTVRGYSAQKATAQFAGRDYVAWFTVEIPIPDGPYIFSGLPGLIVELYDIKKDYHFVLKSMQKLKISKKFQLPEVDTIEKSEFRRLHQIAQKNWPHNMMAELYSNRSNLTKKQIKKRNKDRQEAEQLMKSQNNPIELK